MAEFYFDEIIKVLKFDSLVVYDKVSRINANSEDDDFYLELDVHAEIYQMLPGEKYRMVISNTLHKDGSTGKQASLADKFEYVMHGLLYKMAEAKDAKDDVKVVVYVSFGGLQLMLKGDPLKMHKFKVDQRLFLLLRKM
ncbi:hypothetical protein ABFS82_14G157600 [Erythranthe guttata]|uniref:Uncharacterized protein n=1 Tax=Erythranthe guttata TaxID=4155 RepID=A0A022RTL1_ERYGU|nr:PREDICTED: DNA-directed RNA polymerases II and V subunit 8A-like isoform X2 [Erythranthe guttata]EYU42280.1 hypothetical protein MIMGU_mgv1a015807mg [Erythranthe guttata]|eukprot:XP_012831428.1 PREDICTED: DNA-directed RNA polymerases II and V subunit 8A-like isoform X2 [Erythranthe guttata]